MGRTEEERRGEERPGRGRGERKGSSDGNGPAVDAR